MPPKQRQNKDAQLSVEAILSDPITELAAKHWVNTTDYEPQGKYDPNLVKSIYNTYIAPEHTEGVISESKSSVQLLNYSGYVEKYLWTHFDESSSKEHVFSIINLINEKFQDNIEGIFEPLTTNDKKFLLFFQRVVDLSDDESLSNQASGFSYIKFLINFYRSMESPVVRKTGLRYLFLPIWHNLSQSRLQEELELYPQLKKLWNSLLNAKHTQSNPQEKESNTKADSKKKRNSKGGESQSKKQKVSESQETSAQAPSPNVLGKESSFIPSIIKRFVKIIDEYDPSKSENLNQQTYIAVVLEFMTDLLSQVATRRFLRTLLHDMNIVTKIKMSKIYESPDASIIRNMTNILDASMNFPFHDHSGKALSLEDVVNTHYSRVHRLQQIAYKYYFNELKDLVFSSIGRLLKEETLRKHLLPLTLPQILDITQKLNRISNEEITVWKSKVVNVMEESEEVNEDLYLFALNILLDYFVPKPNQLEAINMLSLYPTEDILWNDSIMPPSNLSLSNQVLSLPKLNLQFLTLYDYLLRNFQLYRLETAYEIREDLIDSIKRMQPKQAFRSHVTFSGWSRMALPVLSTTIDEVGNPKISSPSPSHVHASVSIDISRFSGVIKEEWESIREHDVVFLITIDNPKVVKENSNLDFLSQYGVKYIRGGEVYQFLDEDDVVLNDITIPDARTSGRTGNKRKLRLKLDPAQYYIDLKDGKNCYDSFNVLVRRDPKESNFRSVLETIRSVMNSDVKGLSLPTWFNDVFLGYGNPSSANFRTLGNSESFDFIDTFLDSKHLIESFPNTKEFIFTESNKVVIPSSISNEDLSSLPPPPYKLSFKRGSNSDDSVFVEPYTIPSHGPYPDDVPPQNPTRFTPTQVEAIRSGMNPGLTLIVGPPGTGKTDTAVQIISNLYHNFPNQKIVLVTHSNAALNDLFVKIIERDVNPRHLLRLGSGERELRNALSEAGARGSGRAKGEEFDKQGRVSWCLERRLQLLNQVQHLGQSIQCIGDVGSSCETAEYFYKDQIQTRITKFEDSIKSSSISSVSEIFPFHDYFSDVPENLFCGDTEKDIKSARGCIQHIESVFKELSDYRAFELLRTHAHRSDYLLLKQARIVAMTCTHAAIIRSRLIELDFKYDSLIMEEAAQILDVETVIPMLLQSHDSISGCRLKRVVLLGDHNQLPPIIQNQTIQKYSKFDQSLFTRLVRLGVPTVTLDKQGRARPEISALYSWRYKRPDGQYLGDLPVVVDSDEYKTANTGFLYTYQFIDVPDFKGKGEFAPTPFFYQNLGEAEYVVATYQYMRLMGYPAEKITILTTYNGQRQLIEDIVNQRCRNPLFGWPSAISTVDRYQGQQNDYILLSLVRTASVGHIRDIRRLTVALSRARLGLYVFGRKSLFENCYELSSIFNLLCGGAPSTLQLVVGETFPTVRNQRDGVQDSSKVFDVADVTMMGVLVYQLSQHAQKSSGGPREASADDSDIMEE